VSMAIASRESVEAKGRRYVVEGRLIVELVDASRVRATCRGAGSVCEVGWTEDSGWWCSCPARGRCAHLVAVQLVTVRSVAA